MNKLLRVSRKPEHNFDTANTTWTVLDRKNLYLSDYDFINNIDLKGHRIYCLFTHGIKPVCSVLIPETLVKNSADFERILEEIDKETNNATKRD